jgi:uncharacterized membrane protein YfhO
LFDFLNIRYALVNTDSCTVAKIERPEVCTVMQDPKFTLVFSKDNQAIYQNTHALPRFQLISTYQILSPSNIAQALASPTFAPDQLVYLEEPPPFPSEDTSDTKLTVLEYLDSSIKLSIDTPTPTLLVVSNTYDSGWQAKTNDQIIPVLRANYAFQAYPLPPGSYQLELT